MMNRKALSRAIYGTVLMLGILLTALAVTARTTRQAQSIAAGSSLTVTCETSLTVSYNQRQATIDCAPRAVKISPVALPGRIESENYKDGGEGVGYHDTTPGNIGGAYRSNDVDLQPCTDGDSCINVGWIFPGEWLAYDVNVAQAGNYIFTTRVASPFAGKRFQLAIDGVKVAVLAVPQTGGYQVWDQVASAPIPIAAGAHTITVIAETDGFNLNYIDVTAAPADAPQPTAAPTSEPTAPPQPTSEPTAPPQPTSEPTTPPQPTSAPTTPPQPTAPPPSQPVAGQPCPQAYHDSITTTGPDGKQYATWHPAVDAKTGCLFGHEHGADPRTSKADNTMPAFGYAVAQLGEVEPHTGYKVFVMDNGYSEAGKTAPADVRMVFHMGTSGVKRYVTQFHSMEYDYVARDGSGRVAHVYGMADTGTQIGATCDTPRKGGRDFSTVGCNDNYEIWGFKFQVLHPDDPYTGVTESRLAITGALAAFDPITTRDPADNTRLLYTVDARDPGSGVDPTSAASPYQGCAREFYAGPNYWRNAGKPTEYYTDPYGKVQPGPGPGLIKQEVSATDSDNNLQIKRRQDFCGNGIHAPN